MNWKCYLGCIFLFAGGLYLGYQVKNASFYQKGELEACNEMLGVMSQMNPMFVMLRAECSMYGVEVAIKIGDKYFSMDGKKQFN